MSLADWFRNHGFDEGGNPLPNVTQAPVRPRLVNLPLAPSRDEFAAWRDDPVTRFVMAALERNADECRDEWLRKSWNTGEADQAVLIGLRERADALLGFTADYEAFCETLGLEPEQEEAAA